MSIQKIADTPLQGIRYCFLVSQPRPNGNIEAECSEIVHAHIDTTGRPRQSRAVELPRKAFEIATAV